MIALPLQIPFELRKRADIMKAYQICLSVEGALQKCTEIIEQDLIYIRILGYLVHFLPTDRGLKGVETVSREINEASDTSTLLKLGKMYYEDFIRAFRPNKGRDAESLIPKGDPDSDSDDSCSLSRIPIDVIHDIWTEAPKSSRDARNNALIRDGYRCVVSGRYEVDAIDRIEALSSRIMSDDPTFSIDATKCTYIFVPPTDTPIEPGSEKRDNAGALWAILDHFGYSEIPGELNGSKIHRFENIMTMSALADELFDNLQLWFVKTDEEDKYKLEATKFHTFLIYRELASSGYVTFKSPDPENLPVPSSIYLGIHAACAKVAYFSGASEYIDKIARQHDAEEIDATTCTDSNGRLAERVLDRGITELRVADCHYIFK